MPLAVTDNLNFGNPHKPENFWQLRECVEGLAEGCRAFDTPVTGGNVSLYNESPAGAIDPTPTVGMVGLIDDEKHVTTHAVQGPRAMSILLVGADGLGSGLGASHYLKCRPRPEGRPRAARSTSRARTPCRTPCARSSDRGLVKSAHDCSEGGLAVALAESCISQKDRQLGASIQLGAIEGRLDQTLFNESASRIVISVSAGNAGAVLALLGWRGVQVQRLGAVGGATLEISAGRQTVSWPLSGLHDAWYNSLGRIMGT